MATTPRKARARELMHEGCTCIPTNELLFTAACTMRDLGVGALPICGDDDRLVGMITDRDLVVKCMAAGLDPKTTMARDLAEGSIIYVFDDTPAEDVLATMEEHLIRRVPVIDAATHKLVGIIAQADIATHMGVVPAGELVGAISDAPNMANAR